MRRSKYVVLIKDGRPFQAYQKKLWDEMHRADEIQSAKGLPTNKYPEYDRAEVMLTTLGELFAQHTQKAAAAQGAQKS